MYKLHQTLEVGIESRLLELWGGNTMLPKVVNPQWGSVACLLPCTVLMSVPACYKCLAWVKLKLIQTASPVASGMVHLLLLGNITLLYVNQCQHFTGHTMFFLFSWGKVAWIKHLIFFTGPFSIDVREWAGTITPAPCLLLSSPCWPGWGSAGCCPRGMCLQCSRAAWWRSAVAEHNAWHCCALWTGRAWRCCCWCCW